jgi:NAD-dependent DNA ligase
MEDFCIGSTGGDKDFAVSNIGENIASSITRFFLKPSSQSEVKALILAGFSREITADTESDYLRSLDKHNRGVYIRLKKSHSILETLKSLGVNEADDRLLIKIVAYSRDFNITMGETADALATAIRAKSKEIEIYQLLKVLNSELGRSMISRSGATLKVDEELFRFCREQALFRFKKVLRLFDLGYDDGASPEAAESKVRSFFRGEKWRATALKLWEGAQTEDIYRIPIESIQPGDAYQFKEKALKRLEEQRNLLEAKSTRKTFERKPERELDLVQRSSIPADKIPLANRLLKANNVIETIEALDIQFMNSDFILRLIAQKGDIFTNPQESLESLANRLVLTPKREESLRTLFELLSNKELMELLDVTRAPLEADSELHAYAIQRTTLYSIKCLMLLGAPMAEQLTGHKPDKVLKDLLKQKNHLKYALEIWQAEKRSNINDIQLENIIKGDALRFEVEAHDRLPKKANLSDIESLKKLTSSKTGNVVVISGKVEGLNREEAKVAAEKLGYKVADSVSSSINILVIGEDPGPAKVKKAIALQIPVIAFAELKPYQP